jgi:hypothetical protein
VLLPLLLIHFTTDLKLQVLGAHRDCDLCWSVAVKEASPVQAWQGAADGLSKVGSQRLTTCSAEGKHLAQNVSQNTSRRRKQRPCQKRS